jgi:hypothetical protein
LRGKAFFMRALGTTGAESIRIPNKSQWNGDYYGNMDIGDSLVAANIHISD